MSGPEHYQHAETWLFKAMHHDARGEAETSESCAAIAQVHAMLALATSAPLVDIVGILTEIRDEIGRLPSSGRPA